MIVEVPIGPPSSTIRASDETESSTRLGSRSLGWLV